jgi:hypothetical protein
MKRLVVFNNVYLFVYERVKSMLNASVVTGLEVNTEKIKNMLTRRKQTVMANLKVLSCLAD